MKYKDPTTGDFKEIKIRATDELPVGSEIDLEDGSDVPVGWEEVENEYLSTITAGTPNQTLTSIAEERKTPTITQISKIGSKLSLENNKIKIGNGVHHVKVSANATLNNTSTGGLNVYGLAVLCTRGNTTISTKSTYAIPNSQYYTSLSITPHLIEVQPGDEINFGVYFGVANLSATLRSANENYITVEVVD